MRLVPLLSWEPFDGRAEPVGAAGSTVRVAAFCTPFNAPTIVAVVTFVTDVVAAGNVPVVLPGGIAKVAGTVTCAELVTRLISTPAGPGLAEMAAVHWLERPPTTVAGVQLSEEIVIPDAGGVSVMDATLEEPL